jgi:hypothetical protein
MNDMSRKDFRTHLEVKKILQDPYDYALTQTQKSNVSKE